MKKLSLIAALALGGLLVCSTVAMAQDTNTAPKKGSGGKGRFSAEQRLQMYSDRLSLTDEQKPKVKAVLEESSKQFTGLGDLSQDERRTKMQSIREEETKKMKAILTPDQMEKYTEMQAAMKKKGAKKKTDQ